MAILWACLALFLFRVLAQWAQYLFEWPFLPPFEAWHSAVVPYWLLLFIQLAIASYLGRVAANISMGRVQPTRRSAFCWLGFGLIYFATMAGRMILGLTVLSTHDWFSNRLPTFFHLVLAAFVIVVGVTYLRINRDGLTEGDIAA